MNTQQQGANQSYMNAQQAAANKQAAAGWNGLAAGAGVFGGMYGGGAGWKPTGNAGGAGS